MRLVYFGTSAFAVPALQRLRDHVVLVVTQPDRPRGRGMELRRSDVNNAGKTFGLPVETPEKSRDKAFVERLKELAPDAFVVASYGQILSKALLAVPARGSVNLHASLLPKYRGAAPIQHAVLNGDAETGVTVMMRDEGMATGDVVAMKATPIGQGETAGELHDRLALIAADLAAEWVPKIVAGGFPRAPQDQEKATYAPKVTKADAELSFDRDARAEFDRYRAFTPAPGAWTNTAHGVLKLKKLSSASHFSAGAAPGTVLSTRPFEVAFGQGSLVFESVQPEGRRAVSGEDFANGARLAVGDCLKP